MEKIILSDNHKRAVFSSMFLIEKLALELEYDLLQHNEKALSKIADLDETVDIKHYTNIIEEIKVNVRYMANKYNLLPATYDLVQVINSRKSKMWEILCDTKSKNMRGRGEFPQQFAQEFDSDIDKLLKLTESI